MANYSVVIKEQVNKVEQDILLDLYQPIVGTCALAVYNTLIHEEEVAKKLNIKFDLKRLLKICSLTEKQLNDAIAKLEGMKLVKTFISKKNADKRFTLLAPLSVSEFFANDLYNQTLTSKLGIENVDAIKFIWKDRTEDTSDEFEEVTTSFVDVFSEEVSTLREAPIEKTSFLALTSKKKGIFEKSIDMKLLIANLDARGIQINFKDKKNIKLMNDVLSLVAVNEKTLADAILASYDFNVSMINEELFAAEIQREFDNIMKASTQNIEPKIKEKVQYLETIESKRLINVIFGREIDRMDFAIIDNLAKMGFVKGAINALFEYSNTKNQKLVGNYVYKIAQTLSIRKLFTTVEVVMYLRNAKDASETKKFSIKSNQYRKEQKQNIAVTPEIGYKTFDVKGDIDDSKIINAFNNF